MKATHTRSLYILYYDFGQSVTSSFRLITHRGQISSKNTRIFGSSKIPHRLWTHLAPIQKVTVLESS